MLGTVYRTHPRGRVCRPNESNEKRARYAGKLHLQDSYPSVLAATCSHHGSSTAEPKRLCLRLARTHVGGSVGRSEVAENVPNPIIANPEIVHVPVPKSDTFKEDHSAFKVMVGLRPLPSLGAELSYLDFGHPAGSLFDKPADASMRGESAFGVVYLPVPMVDVFVKAGAAHIQSTVTGFAPNGIPDNVCVVGVPCGTSRPLFAKIATVPISLQAEECSSSSTRGRCEPNTSVSILLVKAPI